jgi:hypothetical protein
VSHRSTNEKLNLAQSVMLTGGRGAKKILLRMEWWVPLSLLPWLRQDDADGNDDDDDDDGDDQTKAMLKPMMAMRIH